MSGWGMGVMAVEWRDGDVLVGLCLDGCVAGLVGLG